MILKLWNWVSNSTDNDSVNKEYISEPKKYEHLTAILNLLYMYNDTCPKLLHTLTDLQPNTFLNTLNELDNVDIAEFNAIKIKAIQFLVILNPTEFSPQKVYKSM